MSRTNRRARTATALAAAALAIAALGGAEVQENAKIPFELQLEIPCADGGAGDVVTLTGDLHVVTTFTINDNVVRGFFHFQPQEVRGVGEATGETYNATGVTQGQFKASLVDGRAHISTIDNFRIIGQGPGNNFLVHEDVHLTIGSNGDIATVVAHVGVDCK